MRLSTGITFLATGIVVGSVPMERNYVLHERTLAPNGLQRGARVDTNSIVPFLIALKQNNLEHGYDYLMNVSHPDSQHYGRLWTSDEVAQTFAPSPDSLAAVRHWLSTAGIQHVDQKKGWLHFETTVSSMQGLIRSEYYEHLDHTGAVRIGCDEYHLPEHISQHVDYITPGVALSAPLAKRSIRRTHSTTRAAPVAANPFRKIYNGIELMTPDKLRTLYDIPSAEEVANSYESDPANTVGVFEDIDVYNQTDLNSFFRKWAPNVPTDTHPYLNSSVSASQLKKYSSRLFSSSAESNIDMDILFSLIYPQTVTLYQSIASKNQILSEGGAAVLAHNLDDFFAGVDESYCGSGNTSTNEECGVWSPARVVSISYGVGEIFIPKATQERQCNEFMKLALQGHTFTVASGDYGVASQPLGTASGGNGCIVPGNYKASTGEHGIGASRNGTVFSPGYPQSCPYVLSVGGTQLNQNQSEESAMNIRGYSQYFGAATFSSSGGFSNYFSRPSYQDDAVNTYFSEHDPGYPHYNFNGIEDSKKGTNIGQGGLYNRIGRAFPDISANGAGLKFFDGGFREPEAGTSLSAPIIASMLTLINEKRTANGKSPVGFVNPVLYKHPEVFTDITRGCNPGCGTDGFGAVEGWDPITGLGTPNYPKLLELFQSLP